MTSTSSQRPVALVTGASGGLGQAIAMTLADQGYHVCLHAHHQLERAEALAEEIKQKGLQASAVQFDVPGHVVAAVAQGH
jgi:3-oxoacyl-[acyl-carrier protein] reductase